MWSGFGERIPVDEKPIWSIRENIIICINDLKKYPDSCERVDVALEENFPTCKESI